MASEDARIEAVAEAIFEADDNTPHHRTISCRRCYRLARAAIAAYEESGQDEARVEVKKEGRKPRTEAKPESIEETRSPDRSTDENEDARVERVAKAIAANDDWEVLDKDKYRRQARAAIAAYEESGQDEARCLDELQRRIESLRIDEADMGDLADEAVAANEMLDAVLVVLQSAESGQFSSSTPQCPDCGFPPDENGNPLCPPSCSVRALDEATAEPSAVTPGSEPSPDLGLTRTMELFRNEAKAARNLAQHENDPLLERAETLDWALARLRAALTEGEGEA